MFSTEEDRKAAEELFTSFPSFDIRVGMDRNDFAEGNLDIRQWQVRIPSKQKIWYTGCGITFANAYANALQRIEEV